MVFRTGHLYTLLCQPLSHTNNEIFLSRVTGKAYNTQKMEALDILKSGTGQEKRKKSAGILIEMLSALDSFGIDKNMEIIKERYYHLTYWKTLANTSSLECLRS